MKSPEIIEQEAHAMAKDGDRVAAIKHMRQALGSLILAVAWADKHYPKPLDLDEQRESFVECSRRAVLDALDEMADELTGNRNDGPKDAELPALFKAIDPIARRIFDKSRGL